MADILLIHTPDKAAFARRLSDAVAAAGYSVDAEATADLRRVAALAGTPPEGSAVLLIWSRPLVSSALLDGWLPVARRNPAVIEVSSDGICPTAGEHEGHVVHVSGWRGQPFHPGWQRLRSEIERVRGKRMAAPEPRPVPAPPAAAAPRTAVAAAPPAAAASARPAGSQADTTERRGKSRKLVVSSVVALSLAGAAVAATSLIGGGGGDDGSPAQALATAAEPRPAAAPPRPVQQPVLETTARAAPAAAALVPQVPETAAPAPTPAMPTPRAAAPTRIAAKAAARAAPPKRAERPVRAETKRYSRRNSKVMRLYCERSGRSTPQCRSFLRSTQADPS